MTIQLAADDRFGLSLPPADAVSQEDIAAAIAAFRDAREAERQARQDATQLEQVGYREAVEKDGELLADALEAGAEDPGTPHAMEAQHEIAAAQRRADASRIVVQRRIGELQTVLDEHGAQWTSDLETELAEARTAWLKLLDELAAQHSYISALQALAAFTTRGRYWAPAPMIPRIGQITGTTLEDAVAALHRFAVKPEPAQEDAAAKRLLRSAGTLALS